MKMAPLHYIAIMLLVAAALIIGFLVPITTYAANVWYGGQVIEGCTARKYIFRGVIATAPDGSKYHWSESTQQWSAL